MILSRAKPAIQSNNEIARFSGNNATKSSMQFEDYLRKRDYAGAVTLMEFRPEKNGIVEQWIAFCAFHIGDYKKALNIYQTLLKTDDENDDFLVNVACCYFYLGMYDESKHILQNVQSSGLKTRLNFHLAHKLRDENILMEYHQQLQDILEDQLSLAAIHYLRAHYQEAIDIYKRLLLQNREIIALNVYVALCYYKLDYYDVSQEVLGIYLKQHPDSVIATNLKACNTFRLYNGTSAENELRSIVEQNSNVGFGYDLLKHNLVVFRDGEDAMQIFPSLVDIVPEARLNLVIHYLRNDDTKEAFDLLKDLQPAVPQEYILKGVVNAALGQELNSQEHIKIAEECFHLVGSSTSECDTIHGRQCMAAAFFLGGQFEEVLVYLTSIKSYLHSDDTFNFDFAQAKTACNQFKEAEETFLLVQDPRIKNDYVYISNLARCYIMNGKPQTAWELYQKMDSSPESFNLLLLIANDCYRMGEFWYSAKAFDMLDKLEPNPEFWEGKRGAIVGVFQMTDPGGKTYMFTSDGNSFPQLFWHMNRIFPLFINSLMPSHCAVVKCTKTAAEDEEIRMVHYDSKKFPVDMLGDVLQLLRSSTSNQADQIASVIRKWAKENRFAASRTSQRRINFEGMLPNKM